MWKHFVTIASGPFKAPNETTGISDTFPPTLKCSVVLALVTSVTLITFMYATRKVSQKDAHINILGKRKVILLETQET